MKTIIAAAALAAVSFTMSGCASADTQAVLKNLQGCERHYNGVVSGGLAGAGFSGSVKIDCPPSALADLALPVR